MNKLELVEHVAKEAELSKASAAAALDAILDGIGKSLKKGDEVDVSVHPQTGAIIVRTGVRYLEGGKVTKRFIEASRRTLAKYDEAFRALAK